MTVCKRVAGALDAPDASRPGDATEEERAFFRALLDHPLGTTPTAPFLGNAMQGYAMRKHIDECHPGDVEKGAGCAPKEGLEREGWLFGYRFVERKEEA